MTFLFVVDMVICFAYRRTSVLHGSDECNRLRSAGAHCLCPPISEHTCHG